jgi:protein kinase C substrate 80K-H
MAVKAAVVGYEEITRILAPFTGSEGEGEGGGGGAVVEEEEIEDKELDDLERKDLEGLLLSDNDDSASEIEGEGGICEWLWRG